MALLKSIQTNYGIDATYWNIFSFNEDFKNKINEIVVVGYVSQEARLAGSDPVNWKNITWVENDYIPDATRAEVYAKLKTTEFTDAQDV